MVCPHCGAALEVSIPAWPHYLTALVVSLLGEAFALVLIVLFLFREGWWVVFAIAAFTSIEFLRSAWLRSRSTVRWINRGSMERRAKGAWAPE